MSETLVIAEPGGWLAEHQREHCAGDSALTTYQGVIADEIVLPESAAAARDPKALVEAANAWAEAMQKQAFYIAGEYAPEAVWGFFAHEYVTDALANGHAHYFMMRGGDAVALECCGLALKSMIADPHFELFRFMVRLKRADAKTAKKLAAQQNYRSAAAAFADLDRRLTALEKKEPLMLRHKTWLKSLRKVKLVPDAEVARHVERLAALNPLRARRQQESARVRAEQMQRDPAFAPISSLCDMAGLRFLDFSRSGLIEMRSIWPEGPKKSGYAYRVDTQRGPRAAVFYVDGGLFKRRLAVLLERGQALPMGSLSLSRADFDAVAPAARKGA
jgi:hypothetical protein